MPAPKDKKHMDIAKPTEAKPDIGSKPMIVGHKMMTDPMVKTDIDTENDEPASGAAPDMTAPEEPMTVTAKKKIAPISESEADGKAAVDNQSEKTDDEAQGEPANAKEESPAVNEPVQENGVKVNDTPSSSKNDAKKDEDDAESSDKVEKSEEQKETPKIDPAAEELEKQDTLRKLIDSKKYHVSIKQARSSASKSAKVWTLVVILLLGLGSLFYLVDTGKLDLGFKLPFSIFGTEEPTAQSSQTPVQTIADEDNSVEETDSATPETYTFDSRAMGFTLEYPSTMEPVADGIGAEDISEVPGEIIFHTSSSDKEAAVNYFSVELAISKDTKDEYVGELYGTGGLEQAAYVSRSINADEVGPKNPGKKVGELGQVKVGTFDAYKFTVSGTYLTGFKSTDVTGGVIDKEQTIYFIETAKGVVRIRDIDGGKAVQTILNTLDELIE